MDIQLISRAELAKLLRTTPQAISNRVTAGRWNTVPRPIKLSHNMWVLEDVMAWLNKKRQEALEEPEVQIKRGRGRPKKKKGDI